jgi:hypothetical protein
MTAPLETFAAANTDLDNMGNALAEGAKMASRLTIDTIIALRSVLDRHQPVVRDRFNTACPRCGVQWPCPDAADVLKVMGLPEDDDDDGRLY